MLLMFIVYSNAVDEEMVEIVTRFAGGYSKFTGVQGEGGREPQLGTHVWPGINNCIMVAVEKDKKKYIYSHVETLKQQFPGVGISIFVTALKEIM